MSKKKIILIISAMVAAAVAIILALRFIFNVPFMSFGSVEAPQIPLTTASAPASKTQGSNVLTGILSLKDGAVLQVDVKKYFLKINTADAAIILKSKGYKEGDTINAMGRVAGETIELDGVNKLVQ